MLAIIATTLIGLIGGAVASRSTGIYFLMITLTYSVIATYTLGQVTKISGFSGIGGINGTPAGSGTWSPIRTGCTTSPSASRSSSTSLIRVHRSHAVRDRLQGVRDEPIRMASLGYASRSIGRSRSASAPSSPRSPGSSTPGGPARSLPATSISPQTINLLIMAVIGGLVRIEGAWVGAFAFILMQNYITSSTHVPLLGFGGTLFGGSFNTLIGIIFLAIVVVSPDGLMGLWGRLFEHKASTGRRRDGAKPAAEPAK